VAVSISSYRSTLRTFNEKNNPRRHSYPSFLHCCLYARSHSAYTKSAEIQNRGEPRLPQRELPSRLTGNGIAALSPKHRKKGIIRYEIPPEGETHRIACLLTADITDISMCALRRSRPRTAICMNEGLLEFALCVCAWEKSVLEGADFASHKKKFLFHV
jgi:hypothetical protein